MPVLRLDVDIETQNLKLVSWALNISCLDNLRIEIENLLQYHAAFGVLAQPFP
jgi:hypothetical protein